MPDLVWLYTREWAHKTCAQAHPSNRVMKAYDANPPRTEKCALCKMPANAQLERLGYCRLCGGDVRVGERLVHWRHDALHARCVLEQTNEMREALKNSFVLGQREDADVQQ